MSTPGHPRMGSRRRGALPKPKAKALPKALPKAVPKTVGPKPSSAGSGAALSSDNTQQLEQEYYNLLDRQGQVSMLILRNARRVNNNTPELKTLIQKLQDEYDELTARLLVLAGRLGIRGGSQPNPKQPAPKQPPKAPVKPRGRTRFTETRTEDQAMPKGDGCRSKKGGSSQPLPKRGPPKMVRK